MKYLLKLAYFNILRAKRRTILTFLILSFGVGMMIFFECLLEGFDSTSTKNVINFQTGHLKVRNKNFDERDPFIVSNFIVNPETVYRLLEQDENILGYTPRIQYLAEIDNMIDVTPIIVIGIDRKRDPTVFTFTNFITEGSLKSGGIVVGKALADDMQIGLNSMVFVTFRNADGALVSLDTYVSGIVHAPDPLVNNGAIFMDIEELKANLNTKGVTEIAVKTYNFKKADKYTTQLQKKLPNHQVVSWYTLQKDVIAITETKQAGMSIFVLMIVIIALVGIINTQLMSVYEKQREIGMMKAIGMTDYEVQWLFIFEGGIIGLFGAIFGVILAILVNLYFSTHGMDVTSWTGNGDIGLGYQVMGIVKSTWKLSSFIKATSICIIASILASFYPARKTTKLQPAECLRITQ